MWHFQSDVTLLSIPWLYDSSYAVGQYVAFWQFVPLKPCCILNSLIRGIRSVFPDLLTVL